MFEEKDFDRETPLYHPDRIGRLTIQQLKTLRDDKDSRIVTGIERIDKDLNPLRGGQLIPVLGYTNNYKSGFMSILCNNAVNQLRDDNEVIVIVSWEDSVEDRGIWDLAGMTKIDTTAMERGELTDTDWKKLLDAAVARQETPVYYIGHSEQDLRRRPRLTLPQVWQVLEHLYDYHGKRARVVALDYLQRIRPAIARRDWRISMMENVDLAKDMAIAFNVPVILGTQAGRALVSAGGKGPKVPQMYHAQETSNIEQSSSAFFSLCLPIKTEMPDSEIEFAGMNFKVTENLLIAGLLKQKRGPAPRYYAFHVDFSTHTLHEVRRYP